MSAAIRTTTVVLAVLSVSAAVAHGRELTFDDRVAAQTAIERVYYSHQIGTDKPFEEAVPRELLERKVIRYLKQSVALEEFWLTPVTGEMLQRELQRMSHGTRLPDRLRQLFAALDDDPFLIQETLARAALVDRLARSFYAFDPRFHLASRQESESISEALTKGTLDPWQGHPRRTEFELIPEPDHGSSEPDSALDDFLRGEDATVEAMRFAVAPERFDQWRRRLSGSVGEARSVAEDREAFHVRVLLEEDDARLRMAAYRVEKTPWDPWWGTVSPELDETAILTVASDASVPDKIGGPDRPWDPQGWEAGDERETGGSSGVPCLDDDTWEDSGLLFGPPGPRRQHTAVWTGSLMLVWGGFGGAYQNTGGRYDPATDTWTPTSIAGAPSPRRSHTAVWTGNVMLVWGGYGGASLNTGGRYDPVTDSWTPTSTTSAPSPRRLHTAVWTGNLMLVWGGLDDTSLNTGGRYDPASDSWMATSTAGAPVPRWGHTAVWTGSLMLVWGGLACCPNSAANTGGRYDPATDTWTPTSIAGAPDARYVHTAVWTGSLMLVWGGGGQLTTVNTGGRYDPATDSWTATSTAGAPSPRAGHTAVWTGSLMLVWGGEYGTTLNTGGRYDPTTDSWMATSTAGAPFPRWSHTAVWTGNLMLVWGGYDGASLNTGGRYDPVTDTWTPISSHSLSPRTHHTAVWTGSLMVVWGGSGFGYHNTGGRYNPATDTWTPTSTVDVPSPRSYHTAVWTGSWMVVWGGTGTGGIVLNTGGWYDPTTDSWTATSTAGAPSPRAGHTAVWTGDLVLVWGGSDGNYLDTGGRYDPATDTWTATTSNDPPLSREGHTAVWTGSLMVVWGGYSNGYLKTGGRYDPATDTWTPTSIAGAPDARRYHTVVWTGSLMLVWGGFACCPFSEANTGGRYDPATDTWTPTSIAGAPDARRFHTVVWTGNLMLVWGGYDGASLNTGGRYDPITDSWTPTSTTGAPSSRYWHTAVWTGSLMLVWGGIPNSTMGGRYALGHSFDDDGDGYTECDGDCNDGNPSIFPGSPELCDGLDNDCNFIVDEDAEPPEIAGLTFESESTFSWQPGPPGLGAIHDIARGLLGELPVGSGAAEMCLVSEPGNTTTDIDPPDPGTGYWYLVRGRNDCGTGTYGQQSDTTERTTAVCP